MTTAANAAPPQNAFTRAYHAALQGGMNFRQAEAAAQAEVPDPMPRPDGRSRTLLNRISDPVRVYERDPAVSSSRRTTRSSSAPVRLDPRAVGADAPVRKRTRPPELESEPEKDEDDEDEDEDGDDDGDDDGGDEKPNENDPPVKKTKKSSKKTGPHREAALSPGYYARAAGFARTAPTDPRTAGFEPGSDLAKIEASFTTGLSAEQAADFRKRVAQKLRASSSVEPATYAPRYSAEAAPGIDEETRAKLDATMTAGMSRDQAAAFRATVARKLAAKDR